MSENVENSNICEIVKTEKNKDKLVHEGFLYTLRTKQHRKFDGRLVYYWRCEIRSCKGTAVTIFENDIHIKQYGQEHTTHAAQANRAKVAKLLQL